MPRQPGLVPRSYVRAIAERLKEFMRRRYRTRLNFAERLGVPALTMRAWLRKTNPAIPDTYYLIVLAQETNLNLNWLLLGEGPELRQPAATGAEGEALRAIAAELRATEKADPAEHEHAWARLQERPKDMIGLAAEAVRPEYHRILRSQWRSRVLEDIKKVEGMISDAMISGVLEDETDILQALYDAEQAILREHLSHGAGRRRSSQAAR
jgi:transcriptional regulator with XRE-family HTH domain